MVHFLVTITKHPPFYFLTIKAKDVHSAVSKLDPMTASYSSELACLTSYRPATAVVRIDIRPTVIRIT